MPYDQLVLAIAAASGVHPDRVKAVLSALPGALSLLEDGQWVRTPLGVFRCSRRSERPISTPDGTAAKVAAGSIVKLSPGVRLRRVD